METQKQPFYKYDSRFKMEPYIQQQLDAYIASEKEKPENRQHPTAKMLNCASVRINLAKFLSYFESMRRTDELEKVSFQYDDEIVTKQFAVMSFSEIVAKVGISKSQAERVRKVVDEIGLVEVGKGQFTRKRMYTPNFEHPLIAALRLNEIPLDKNPHKQPDRGYNSIEEDERYNFMTLLYTHFNGLSEDTEDRSAKKWETISKLANRSRKSFSGMNGVEYLNKQLVWFKKIHSEFQYLPDYCANPFQFLNVAAKYNFYNEYKMREKDRELRIEKAEMNRIRYENQYGKKKEKVYEVFETAKKVEKITLEFDIDVFTSEHMKVFDIMPAFEQQSLINKYKAGEFGTPDEPKFQLELSTYLNRWVINWNAKIKSKSAEPDQLRLYANTRDIQHKKSYNK